MIVNVSPTLMRIITQPADPANSDPRKTTQWWTEGRTESTRQVDSTTRDPNCLSVRDVRPLWLRWWRTGSVKSALRQGYTATA